MHQKEIRWTEIYDATVAKATIVCFVKHWSVNVNNKQKQNKLL